MFARRNFVYKRGAHLNHVARYNPVLVSVPSQVPSPSSSSAHSSVAATTTSPLTSPTPVESTPTTTETPKTSTPSSTSPSSTETTRASSSSSSSTSAPSTLIPSSVATATSSTPSTSLNVSPATTAYALPVSTQVVTGISFTPTSSHAPSTTSSPSSASGTNTGSIIGGVVGTLAGIAVIGFLLMWCMRRQRNRDIDDFDAQAFKRQSAILVDDPVQPSQSYNPRPPTMIERHNASPALALQTGFGGQNHFGNYGGYGQQPAYPPEMGHPSGSPPPQAYAAPPMGYTGHDEPRQQIARQPSSVGFADHDSRQQPIRQPPNAKFLTRQPSSAAGYAPSIAPPSSLDLNARYIDLKRSSVSPYQAAQYADISRQLGNADSNDEVPHESHELPDGPLPSPFDDPAEPNQVPHVTSRVHSDHPSSVVTVTPTPQTHGNTPALHQRPTTLYEEGDAYGGI